jgi:hypothetical protein
MKSKHVSTFILAVAILLPTPIIAKQQAEKGKGAFCTAGGENVFIPGASFSAKVRASMRKGQKVNVNIAGFGPVSCVIY